MSIADKGTRFGNYLIDSFCIALITIILTVVFDVLIQVIPGVNFLSPGFYWLVFYFGYYFLFELFGGRTPAKYLTKTKVINNDGNKPGFKQIFLRSLGRVIPIDSLSFLFGSGFHDYLSHTTVIYIKKK